MQDCKDWSGLQFITFDFLTGGQKIKLDILVEFWLFWPLFCLFGSYFFASITFGDGFFQFQDNKVSLKQAPGHHHGNTIFQPRKYIVSLSFLGIHMVKMLEHTPVWFSSWTTLWAVSYVSCSFLWEHPSALHSQGSASSCQETSPKWFPQTEEHPKW